MYVCGNSFLFVVLAPATLLVARGSFHLFCSGIYHRSVSRRETTMRMMGFFNAQSTSFGYLWRSSRLCFGSTSR